MKIEERVALGRFTTLGARRRAAISGGAFQ